MSDEVKVQNPTGTLSRKNLATLGQVKDALDKRDKKIDSLTEDLSNKITKFYAPNQGETHLADSDNGKIMDMMLYGKSSQDGTPTPENLVEIKSVVNPTVKVFGKNLWNPILGGYISGNNGSIVETSKTQSAVTDFIKTSGKDITVIARNFSSAIGSSYTYRIGLYNVEKKWIKNIFPSDGNKYSINTFNTTGTEYIRVSAPSGIYDTIQIEKGSEATSYEPYTEQSVQLPYALNAIPVTSGGNVTIGGQQYIADYVDVERGKVVRKINKLILTGEENWQMGFENWGTYPYSFRVEELKEYVLGGNAMNAKYPWYQKKANQDLNSMNAPYDRCIAVSDARFSSVDEFTNELKKQNSNGTPLIAYYVTGTPQEENLSLEEIKSLKSLSTYYPVTNISANSEQLDGYTVFNYPISMANGWNYVKQQLNDNRDYIYDMDTQSAEAYVNSEYAVVLTELEV